MSVEKQVIDKTIVLEGRNIEKAFSGVTVLKGVTAEFHPGEVHTLMGENGAGKSTLFKILSGVYSTDKGEIFLNGQKASFKSPRIAHQSGIYMVPQEPALMEHLTVAENIFLGISMTKGSFLRAVDWKNIRQQSKLIMERLGFNISVDQPAGYLSIAQQQIVECARALAHNCRVVLFDEPTSPLTSHEVEALFEVIKSMKKEGYSIGFISHRMEEVLEISDRITVLRDGQLMQSVPKAKADRNVLVENMIGRKFVGIDRRKESFVQNDPVLRVKNLSGKGFNNISFDVKKGEVLGLAGLVGSGRTEIAEAIFNVRAKNTGDVLLNNESIAHYSTRKIIKSGLIYLPEDRAHHGSITSMTVSHNISSGDLDQIIGKSRLLLDLKRERDISKQAILDVRVKTASIHAKMKSLSGGNQQKAIFGKWLLTKPMVAILDEPTRGVDAGAKQEIYQLIEDLAKNGMAVMVISSELEEIVRLSDRVLAIYEGNLVGELSNEAISMDNIGKLILNHE